LEGGAREGFSTSDRDGGGKGVQVTGFAKASLPPFATFIWGWQRSRKSEAREGATNAYALEKNRKRSAKKSDACENVTWFSRQQGKKKHTPHRNTGENTGLHDKHREMTVHVSK